MNEMRHDENYRKFAHVNQFLKQNADYRHKNDNAVMDDATSNAAEQNIYKKAKSTIKNKGYIQ